MYNYSNLNDARTLRETFRHFKYLYYDSTVMYLKNLSTFPEMFFSCGRNWYQYARFRTNTAYNSERVVEIPIIMKYINECEHCNILEVGNVLSHYYRSKHTIIDKYEKGVHVQNIDVVDYKPEKKFDLIIAISTIEHVGFDEDDFRPEKAIVAIEHLKSILKPYGKMVITVPLGYNKYFDSYIKEGKIHFDKAHFLKRITDKNEWEEQEISKLYTETFKYGSPFPYGNSVLIMVWEGKN